MSIPVQCQFAFKIMLYIKLINDNDIKFREMKERSKQTNFDHFERTKVTQCLMVNIRAKLRLCMLHV